MISATFDNHYANKHVGDYNMNARKLISLCAAVGALSLIGCQSTETASAKNYSATATNTTASKSIKPIEFGRFMRNVIAGKNYTGQEFTMYGVALNATDSGIVNIGSRDMYQAGEFETFVSVSDVPRHVKPGSLVQFNVKVESTHKGQLPNGEAFVVVEAAYLD